MSHCCVFYSVRDSRGPNGRNIPREGPTPELGVAPDLDFGMDMDFPETVPEFCTLKSIFTQAGTPQDSRRTQLPPFLPCPGASAGLVV